MIVFDVQQKTDKELVTLALQDPDNFLHIMQRYEAQLLRYVMRTINASESDAEDILQEVFLKVYQNLNGFDQRLKFSSWIYRITYNHTISYYRKNKKHSVILSVEDNQIMMERLASDLDIQEQVDTKIVGERVATLLNKLDKKYRQVLILKYLEEKDYKEISDILRKPSGTVATLINRAKEKFKSILLANKITPQL